jgi:hypothetical protein
MKKKTFDDLLGDLVDACDDEAHEGGHGKVSKAMEALTAVYEKMEALVAVSNDPIVTALRTASPTEARATLSALASWVEDLQDNEDPEVFNTLGSNGKDLVEAGSVLLDRMNAGLQALAEESEFDQRVGLAPAVSSAPETREAFQRRTDLYISEPAFTKSRRGIVRRKTIPRPPSLPTSGYARPDDSVDCCLSCHKALDTHTNGKCP